MTPKITRALALICTLRGSPSESSTELLAHQVLAALREHDVESSSIRVVDHDVRPGVELDMGSGDAWPAIRQQVADADILLLATPTWMGQPSSVCARVLERLDAELSLTGDDGRLATFDKVGIVAVVGNEDGAHHISAIVFQVLNDVGFTIPAQGVTYWNGEAMHRKDYKDLAGAPDEVASATATVARHAAHLAKVLKAAPFPAA